MGLQETGLWNFGEPIPEMQLHSISWTSYETLFASVCLLK